MSESLPRRGSETEAERNVRQPERVRGCLGCSGCLGVFINLRNWMVVLLLSLPGSQPVGVPESSKNGEEKTDASLSIKLPQVKRVESSLVTTLVQQWFLGQSSFKSERLNNIGNALPQCVVSSYYSTVEDEQHAGFPEGELDLETELVVVVIVPPGGNSGPRTYYYVPGSGALYQK